MARFREIVAAMAAATAALAAASCLHPIEPTSVCTQSTAYALGDTVNDSLASGDCVQGDGAFADYYRFVTTGQENLRVTLSSPALRTFVQLYDLQRGAILVNSAVAADPDTTTTVRMMIGPGSWALAVNAVNSGQRGTYRMVVQGDTAAVKGCSTVWVTPGILTTQTITNADCTKGPGGAGYYYHIYTIVLLQPQEVNLSEHSTAFAPGMTLVGPSGTFPSSPDSAGTTALISTTVSSQGAYGLWVGSANPSQFGVYTLQIK